MAALVWLLAANFLAAQSDFDWSQDIGAYAENLEATPDFILDSIKGFWYEWVVFPLNSVLGDTELTLALIRSITLSLFFISQMRVFRSHLDCAAFVAVLLLTPALSENLFEYLRQGMAIALFMAAISSARWPIRAPLLAVALMTHNSVGLLAVAVLCGWLLGKTLERTGQAGATPLIILIVAVMTSLSFGFFGGEIIRTLAFDEIQPFLSGSRDNPLALAYLTLLTVYAGYQSLIRGSRAHLPAFIGFAIIASSYSVILDFGRVVSLILPLHLAAAMTLTTRRARYMDLLGVFVAGSAFMLA